MISKSMMLALSLSTALFTTGTAYAETALKDVRIVVGTTALNISYPWLNLPVALNYWREEGYNVTVTPLAPPAQPIALLVAGQADFAQINSSVVVQAQTQKNEPVKLAMLNGVIDWSVGVLDNSPVKSIADLKGKNIGVFSLASGGVPLLRSQLQAEGVDPDNDVKLIAVGGGAAAAQALQSGRVAAIVFWAGAMAGFENAGLKLRYMRGDDWQKMPDFVLAVMGPSVQKDPKMVEAIARGAAKAELFAITNPDCVRRIQWKTWPATKPTGSTDEATLARWDENTLSAQLDTLKKAYELTGGKLYGNVTTAVYDKFQDYLLATNQITKKVPSDSFLIGGDFYAKINAFDKAKVVADATACQGF